MSSILFGKQGRLSVHRDLRTRKVHAIIDDGIMWEPSDPYKTRTPEVLARGIGDTLVQALQSMKEVA